MTIDRSADRALYRQLADLLRERIRSGELAAGALLPAEGTLGQQYGLGRDAVRSALAVLRSEGLIVTDHLGSHVREQGEVTAVTVPAGADITSRMPTEAERRELAVAEGIPVLVVAHDGEEHVYPSDRYRLSVSG